MNGCQVTFQYAPTPDEAAAGSQAWTQEVKMLAGSNLRKEVRSVDDGWMGDDAGASVGLVGRWILCRGMGTGRQVRIVWKGRRSLVCSALRAT
jgi:hypothetical protein